MTRAIGRPAFVIVAATLLFAAAPASAACFLGIICPSDQSSEAAAKTSEAAAEQSAEKPVNLKSYRKRSRHARRSHRHRYHQVARKHRDGDEQGGDTSKDDVSKVTDARTQAGSPAAPDNSQAKQPEQAIKPQPEQAIQQAAPAAATAVALDPAVQVVDADELNEVDQAISQPLPASIANSRAEMAEEQQASTWAQTSTIGKTFIVFGVLLTLASAARMFLV